MYNVTAVEAEQLEQRIPLIVARGVARLALRRGTVAYLNDKDPSLGTLADFGMLVANACTQADTRSWRTLPASIDIARYEIPAGEHTLHIQIEWGVFPSYIEEFKLKLHPGAFCLINIFNLHPGCARVQIPFHCKT